VTATIDGERREITKRERVDKRPPPIRATNCPTAQLAQIG
jgi:hypothetical protein